MAIVRAVKSGNWSDTTVWNTGALPTSADDVYANTFTVTIDTSPTVLSIRSTSATGVTAGGQFQATTERTLTCTGTGVLSGTAYALAVNLTSGQSFSVVSNITGGAGVAVQGGVIVTGAGTLNVTGNISGGGAFSVGNAPGLRNDSTGIINITGNVTATGTDNGVINNSTGTVNLTGNATGGSSASFGAIGNISTGSVNVTGIATAGSAGSALYNNSSGQLTHIGTANASATATAISIGSTSQNTYLTGPFIGTAQGLVANNALRWRWIASVGSSYMTVPNSTATGYKNLFTADNTSSASGQPAASNVRSGTVYGPASELTGTCTVPVAGSVALGVAVDNTTGTAVLTAANVRTAVGLASANLDTQLAAIPTTPAPTVTAIRTELDANSTKLANLDATVSSRLASSGYTAPLDATGTRTAMGLASANLDTQLSGISSGVSGLPSAATIATAVWAAATRTLTTAIDNSATIAAAVWSYATGRTITGGTVDTLTNAPTVPSAAAIATQVRTELATELGRIDVATSTRLAPAGTLARVTLADTTTTLTNAPSVPSAAAIASQVRTELTPELARMANAATVDTTGQQIQDAVTN